MTKTTTRAGSGLTYAAMTAMVNDFLAAGHLDNPVIRQRFELLAEHYSERNAILILAQCPVATRLRAYEGWQSEGRQVRKGEKAIKILKWIGGRDRREPTVAEAAELPEGEIRRRFGPASLFDISQTKVKGEVEGPDAPVVDLAERRAAHTVAEVEAQAREIALNGIKNARPDRPTPAAEDRAPATRRTVPDLDELINHFK